MEKRIELKREGVTCDRLRELLAEDPGATHLLVEHSEKLDDLSFVTGATSLRFLSLRGCCSIEDLSPLSILVDLEGLTLARGNRRSPLKSIAPLSTLVGLQSLTITRYKQVTDISALSHLRELRTLNMKGLIEVRSLRPLSRLTKLMSLDLTYNEGHTDLRPLSKLKSLRYLTLDPVDRHVSVGEATPSPAPPILDRLDLRPRMDIDQLRRALPACQINSTC